MSSQRNKQTPALSQCAQKWMARKLEIQPVAEMMVVVKCGHRSYFLVKQTENKGKAKVQDSIRANYRTNQMRLCVFLNCVETINVMESGGGGGGG